MPKEQEHKEPAGPPAEKIWIVCSVCNKVLQVGNIPGDKRTSHGLCKECSRDTIGDI